MKYLMKKIDQNNETLAQRRIHGDTKTEKDEYAARLNKSVQRAKDSQK